MEVERRQEAEELGAGDEEQPLFLPTTSFRPSRVGCGRLLINSPTHHLCFQTMTSTSAACASVAEAPAVAEATWRLRGAADDSYLPLAAGIRPLQHHGKVGQ